MTWHSLPRLPRVQRLRRMGPAEILWRATAGARVLGSRVRTSLRAPGWNRAELRRALASNAALEPVRAALAERRWQDAHRELSKELAGRPSRFLISPGGRTRTADRIRRAFPDAAADAAARADRIIGGRYDLLGYSGLEFAGDWHYDPVNGRRAPRLFWSAVPYLDPACGDHKIIWELNRHQHWLALGRAYWLTGRSCYRDRFQAELRGWIDTNPPFIGINWASMLELGLRALSWIWALNFFVDAGIADSEPWTVDLLLALDRQLTHIEQNLSYYFSPNTHLLGEALGLYVSSRALPELAGSSRREEVGRRILTAEIERQIAVDGGHCERSTHYHRYALDFYLCALAVARITEDRVAPVFEHAVRRLAWAARLLADDQGRAPHIGDDDGGMLLPIGCRAPDDWRDSLTIAAKLLGEPELRIGRSPEEAFWVLADPGLRSGPTAWAGGTKQPASTHLPATGYYVSRSRLGEHIVIDGGPHGYGNGGHAHADALSLTLSLRGLPLLIDPGTGCYSANRPLRDRFRSTSSHNTVVVDGLPQSVPGGLFHWTRTVDARVGRWRSTGGFDYFEGSHEAYAPVEHRRHVLVVHGDLLVVADLVVDLAGDRRPRTAAAHWHIDPAWEVTVDGQHAQFRSRGERVTLVVPGSDRRLEAHCGEQGTGLGWYSPVYGLVGPTTVLTVSHERAAPFWIGSVFDLNPRDPIVAVEWLPVWAEPGAIAQSAALRISRNGSTDILVIAHRAHPQSSPPTGAGLWRVAEFESDAAMLFWRVAQAGELTRMGLVDGSAVRSTGRRVFRLSLAGVAGCLWLDDPSIRSCTRSTLQGESAV